MDKLESWETSPCLFCLTPVEGNRNINIELKTNYWNYQDIVACSLNFLKGKINGQHFESVCTPDKPFNSLCEKCFKWAEKIHKVNKKLMELSKILEDVIEKFSLEINERISILAPDGYLYAGEIKVEEVVIKEEISDRVMNNLDGVDPLSEEHGLLTPDEFHNNDLEIAGSVLSPLHFLSDEEWGDTDVDPLKLDGTSDVDEVCESNTSVPDETVDPALQKKMKKAKKRLEARRKANAERMRKVRMDPLWREKEKQRDAERKRKKLEAERKPNAVETKERLKARRKANAERMRKARQGDVEGKREMIDIEQKPKTMETKEQRLEARRKANAERMRKARMDPLMRMQEKKRDAERKRKRAARKKSQKL